MNHRFLLWRPLALLAFTPVSHGFVPSTRAFSIHSQLAMKKVLVPIADGSEEIETTCITDTLVRFGAEVTIASVMPQSLTCTMSRGIRILADCSIEEAVGQDWDLVALPGGMPGAEHLRDSPALTQILQAQKQAHKLYAAVCAAPAVALASQNLLDGAEATCYPAPKFRDVLPHAKDDKVVVHDNVITSQGPGTSLLFALQLGEALFGKEKRDQIAKEMLVEA